jgi:group I intron endonuclease
MTIDGVYAIINLVNGKAYVDPSANKRNGVWGRLAVHLSRLMRNEHPCKHLQNAWNKHGKDAFIFYVLLETSHEMLTPMEEHWMDRYAAWGGLYNARPAADSNLGYKYTPESRAKIRAAVCNPSPETRAKMSAASRGRTPSPETRAKISTANRGKLVRQKRERR